MNKKQPLPTKKAGRRPLLTPEQEKWLIEVFPGYTNAVIADTLTQSSAGTQIYSAAYIAQQGHRLQLKKDKYIYSDEEIAFMKANVNALTWPEIAEHLQRTPGAVRKKWHQLQKDT